MMQEQLLTGCITRVKIFNVPEFGRRASFTLECLGEGSVTCAVGGNLAREFVAYYREGDIVRVTGTAEPSPSTASFTTSRTGRFRVRTLRVAEAIWAAA